MCPSNLAAYTIDGQPIRSFQDEGTTWFCVNDLALLKHPEYGAVFINASLTFISKDMPTADPDVAEIQRLLKIKFSN